MGVFKHFSSSSNDCFGKQTVTQTVVKFTPSPEISNYEIVKFEEIRGHLVVKIRYKDVTNYEGNKIMVYRDCSMKDLHAQKLIDPHFSDNDKMHSPFARFEPTAYGWTMACITAYTL
jgi:hypothetical protein